MNERVTDTPSQLATCPTLSPRSATALKIRKLELSGAPVKSTDLSLSTTRSLRSTNNTGRRLTKQLRQLAGFGDSFSWYSLVARIAS